MTNDLSKMEVNAVVAKYQDHIGCTDRDCMVEQEAAVLELVRRLKDKTCEADELRAKLADARYLIESATPNTDDKEGARAWIARQYKWLMSSQKQPAPPPAADDQSVIVRPAVLHRQVVDHEQRIAALESHESVTRELLQQMQEDFSQRIAELEQWRKEQEVKR